MYVELPNELQFALEDLFRGFPRNRLRRIAKEVTTTYRAGLQSELPRTGLSTEVVSAYAAYRLPATYAATFAALSALREQRPEWKPRALLDLGAGLGSGMWAATALWPEIESITAIDSQEQMIAIGQRLAHASPHSVVRSARWIQADLLSSRPIGEYDLVIIGYVLGWMDSSALPKFLRQSWEVTREALVSIEPGTPRGHAHVLTAYQELVAQGGFSAAPCPHNPSCIARDDDWHHFSVRLPRIEAHRAAKDATLGFEDEKYSYVVMTRIPLDSTYSRILRHPIVREGHVRLKLCTSEGPQEVVISKREKDLYRRARNAVWGGTFEVLDHARHDTRCVLSDSISA